MDKYQEIFGDKSRILVVFAHPDDAEIMAGGTISRLTADGKTVRVVKMTSGENGSRQNEITRKDLKDTRVNEDGEAMNIMGIKPEDNVYLDLGDGSVENDLSTIEKLAFQIRQFKPDIIITHNPENVIVHFAEGENWVNHRDHRHTGQSVVDAAYPYARDINFFPEQLKQDGVESHITKEFLFTDFYDHPDTIAIDVTDFMENKIKALSAHASQFDIDNARNAGEFIAMEEEGRRWEKFRHVVAD